MVLTFNEIQATLTIDVDNAQKEIEALEEAACETVIGIIGKPIIETQIKRIVPCAQDFIQLPHRNMKLDSIEVRTIDGEQKDIKYISYDQGFVFLEKNIDDRNVECTYTIGWALIDVPENIKYCIRHLIMFFWEKKKEVAITSKKSEGGYDVAYEKNIPRFIYTILERYR